MENYSRPWKCHSDVGLNIFYGIPLDKPPTQAKTVHEGKWIEEQELSRQLFGETTVVAGLHSKRSFSTGKMLYISSIMLYGGKVPYITQWVEYSNCPNELPPRPLPHEDCCPTTWHAIQVGAQLSCPGGYLRLEVAPFFHGLPSSDTQAEL